MTATSLNLGGQPAQFLGAYVANVNSSLGLAQSPSTCTVTLVEDLCVTPQVLFEPPDMGAFETITAGQFTFAGVITGYQEDLANIGGRQITVNLSDPREIMKSIPIIIAPGYRVVADVIEDTGCSVIDAFGAYDDEESGLNLSGWNQAGMRYADIARAFKGGSVERFGILFKVPTQFGKAFGITYFFDLDEITAKVDPGYRLNSNLINVADMVQDLASRHSFDWFVESVFNQSEGRVDVTFKIIDRSVDNIDLDLDSFLAANSGFVQNAQRGFELRNELSCAVLLGAPVESLRTVNIDGMANNPIDLSSEGGSDKYFMTEEEMRHVLIGKETWKCWLESQGTAGSGLARYALGGATVLAPLWNPGDASDVANQLGINPDRFSVTTIDEETTGRLYDKLQANASASYGKRFLFDVILDAELIDAAWTSDTVAGNNDPNEYFRNEDGKTRCYIEFANPNAITFPPDNTILGIGPSFVFGLGDKAPQPLDLQLKDSFSVVNSVTNLDKADWIIDNGKLYVAATIEEGNVIKLDAPIVIGRAEQVEVELPEDEELPEEEESAEDEELPTSHTENKCVEEGVGDGKRATAGGLSSEVTRIKTKRIFVFGEADFSLHQRAYQPTRAFIPTKSKFTRYGPVFASNIDEDSQGALSIDQDDGFAPWEFGGTAIMLDAMQFRVDNASSNVKTVESATITIEGLPKLSIGDTIGKNSNVNNISISFGNGVTTTYELRSFLRSFGELSKQELASLSLFARRSGARILPQDTVSFINRYRPIISKQFAGKGSKSSSATVGGAGNFE